MSVVDKIAESIDRVTDRADELKEVVVDELKEIGADFRDGFQAGTEAMQEIIDKAYQEGIKVPLDNAIEKIEDITGIKLDTDLGETLEAIQDKLLEELLEYLSTLSIVIELKAEGKAKVHLSTSLFSYDVEFDVCVGFTYNFKLLDWTRVNLFYNIDNGLIKFKVEINDKVFGNGWIGLKFAIPTTPIPSMMRKQCDEDEDEEEEEDLEKEIEDGFTIVCRCKEYASLNEAMDSLLF